MIIFHPFGRFLTIFIPDQELPQHCVINQSLNPSSNTQLCIFLYRSQPKKNLRLILVDRHFLIYFSFVFSICSLFSLTNRTIECLSLTVKSINNICKSYLLPSLMPY